MKNNVTSQQVDALRTALNEGRFPGISFKQAMKFLLTDGTMPADDLPLDSMIALDDWRQASEPEPEVTYFTATDLKNHTGRVVRAALLEGEVVITKHGAPWVRIHAVDTSREPRPVGFPRQKVGRS